MSILDVTEDQIFHTLGKGRDPNFKPIEKVRPVIAKPKKTYTLNIKNFKTTQTAKPAQPVQAVTQPVITVPQTQQVDDSVKRITEDLNELNNRVAGIQKMVKWYIVPQFIVVLVLFLALVVKS
ncbi:MAG: hypothetical protein PHU34_10910 [Candidatus Methanoperedens sp.]|nr:hypothetical protein [Candidatus Methanoperedens sp.]